MRKTDRNAVAILRLAASARAISVSIPRFQMTKYVQRVEDIIDEKSERLHEIGRFLWENPEVRFEEEKAHDFLTGFLESEGFQLQRNYILPTAFRAEYGGKPSIFLCTMVRARNWRGNRRIPHYNIVYIPIIQS